MIPEKEKNLLSVSLFIKYQKVSGMINGYSYGKTTHVLFSIVTNTVMLIYQ